MLTLLTVQNTVTVEAVEILDPAFVIRQLRAVLNDIPPKAAKTGALGNSAVIEAIAEAAVNFHFPLVVDPVMISKHGAPLIAEEARALLAARLMPRAFLITPNLHEAGTLAYNTVLYNALTTGVSRRLALLRFAASDGKA